MTMNATKAEVLTEEEQRAYEYAQRAIHYFAGGNGLNIYPLLTEPIDRLIGELTSLRASRDEAVKERDEIIDSIGNAIGCGRVDSPECRLELAKGVRDLVECYEGAAIKMGEIEATVARLEGERDAVVKAAQDVADISHEYKRDWITEDEWDKFFALQSALAQVSAPAPAREQAKDECNCDLRDRQWNPVTKRCNFCHRPIKAAVNAPAPAAPATSGAGEQYEGVRVWRSDLYEWIHGPKSSLCIDRKTGAIGKSKCSTNNLNRAIPELHGPERLAVIEKALKLKPDLFDDPKPIPASERIHELEERANSHENRLSELEASYKRQLIAWSHVEDRVSALESNSDENSLARFTAAALTGYIANGDYTPEECSTKAVECGRATLAAITGGGR